MGNLMASSPWDRDAIQSAAPALCLRPRAAGSPPPPPEAVRSCVPARRVLRKVSLFSPLRLQLVTSPLLYVSHFVKWGFILVPPLFNNKHFYSSRGGEAEVWPATPFRSCQTLSWPRELVSFACSHPVWRLPRRCLALSRSRLEGGVCFPL